MITARLRFILLTSMFTTASAVPVAAQVTPRASAADSVPRAGQSPKLYSLLFSCSAPTIPPDSGGGPRIVVTPLGQVLDLRGPINEGDSVRVVVMGHETLLRRLVVARTSGTRVRGIVNVVGQPLVRLAPDTCRSARWTLRDFAAGKGEIEISVLWPTAKPDDNIGYTGQSLAKLGFPVNTLYGGALFFGPIVTGLENPDFVARANVTDTTIAYSGRPGARLEYALFFTNFWGGTRDVEADRRFRLDPLIGLVLNDVPNNLLLGLTAHAGYSFYVVGGAQFGLVRRLDASSNLQVGGRIHTLTASVPVNKRFGVGWFAGFGLDMRAVGRLFGLVSK